MYENKTKLAQATQNSMSINHMMLALAKRNNMQIVSVTQSPRTNTVIVKISSYEFSETGSGGSFYEAFGWAMLHFALQHPGLAKALLPIADIVNYADEEFTY